MNDIITLINGVGFPIVACVYMAKRDEKTTEVLNQISIALKGIEKRLDMEDNNE